MADYFNHRSPPSEWPDTEADVDPGRGTRGGLDYTPPPRLGAFRAAGRHTARVRFLRRAIIVGSVLAVSLIALIATFDPFRHLPRSVSISGVGVKGTKVTMDTPKITGVQQGGSPYDIAARTGIQDITTPNVIELLGVDAHVGMHDDTMTHVTSDHGVYDSKEDTMALDGHVLIANTSGYTFGLKRAMIDFKHGTLYSEERTRVDIKGGFVLSDAIVVSDNGHKVVFRGHIDSTFDPPDDDSPPEPAEPAPDGSEETVH